MEACHESPHNVGTTVALVASEFYDSEGTQHCLKLKACTEGNPIFFSSHPSRARTYSIALALHAIGIYGMGWMEQRGHGFVGWILADATITMHIIYGYEGFHLPK